MRPTVLTIEAEFAFPGFGNVRNLGLQTERVVGSITNIAKRQIFFMGRFTTDFARFTVNAFPIRPRNVFGGEAQAVDMVALCTESTCQKVFLVSESSTKIAHILKNEPGIVE